MNEQTLPNLAAPFTDAVESLEILDPVGATVGRTVRTAVPEGAVKDILGGVPIGHALHPLLTDVVIGSFVSVNLLDLLGGDRSGEARERLLAIGIAAYFPTALTGASDYSDVEEGSPAVRRSGLVHAALNATALGCYVASLRARRRGPGGGKLWAALGAGALGAAGHLGGHLTYARGAGVGEPPA